MASPIQKTLLEIVQEILIAADSDNVNSISDTDESNDVASIVRDVFFDLVARQSIPEHRELIKVTALGDTTRPNYLKLPDNVKRLCKLDYNISTDANDFHYRELQWRDPEEFIKMTSMSFDDSDTTKQVVLDINGSTRLFIRNDKMPHYFTSFDDLHIVCDSFDSGEENTLQEANTRAYAILSPTFTLSDTFVPDLDDAHFRFLVNEAKSTAVSILNKNVSPKVEQAARKARFFSQNKTKRFEENRDLNNFGRS